MNIFIKKINSFFQKNKRIKCNANDRRFVFIIPSYNCKLWYKKNLHSIFQQTYINWRAIYIDDCSFDGTGTLALAYIAQNGYEKHITVIQNNKRQLALYNIYYAIHSCDDNEIAILLDGDDWLANKNVLDILNETYNDPNIWLTYGSYSAYPGGGLYGRDIPNEVRKNNSYREFPWSASHLRTFYCWLFKKIKKEDLMSDGSFFAVSWDQALMFPMLEMSGGRFKCITDHLYVYNISNPLNDGRVHGNLPAEIAKFITKKDRYSAL